MKTKILLHLFILAIICTTSVFNAYALTTAPPFSGHISGGGITHWYNSGNGGYDIYPINGPVYIDNGNTLQIDANVTLQFNPGQSLLVYGTLDASAGNITFTSSGGTSPNSWGSIQLATGSVADLTGATIEYGSEIDVDGTLTLNGTFINTMTYGLAIESAANVSMSGTNITNCTYPIMYNGHGIINGSSSIPNNSNTLSGNTFSSNTNESILMNYYGYYSNSLTLPTASIPYYFLNGYEVLSGGSLTIEQSNILEFNNGNSLTVYGSLIASAGNIIFTSSSGISPGSWGSIWLEAGSIADLTGATIQYGNEFYTDGTLTLSGSTINTMNYSLVVDGNANVSMTTTTIENWKQYYYPIYYVGPGSINGAGSPGNTSNSLSGNIFSGTATYVAILVDFGGNSNSFTLPTSTTSPATTPPNMVIPYVFPSSYEVDSITGSLTIEPGNILKFGINQGLYVYGTLTAVPPPSNPIYFTSIYDDNLGGDANGDGNATQPASQNWAGVVFTGSHSNASQMSYCQVRFAGAGTNIGAVTMYNASPAFNSCTFSNSYFGAAIYYGSSPVFTADTFASADMTPIGMSLEALPSFTTIDLNHANIFSFENNKYQAIGLLPGTVTANGDLSKRAFGFNNNNIHNPLTLITNVTYLLLGQIIIPPGITMTIDRGIVIKGFSQSQSLLVEGTLIADGNSQDSMITFTSAADDNFGQPGDTNDNGDITSPVIGDWGGIIFDSTATNSNTTLSILNFCRIQYASTSGSFYQTNILGGAIATIQASPKISNCNINNAVYGILCYFSSNPTITDDSLLDITSTPIAVSPAAHPVFTGCTFTNVGLDALGLIGGNVGVSGCVIQQNVAGITNITYVLLTDMTINSGTYVCVSPGVVIKIDGRVSIYVNGGFQATGAIFTSIKDDNVGHPGDTNEDGNATFPAPCDWGAIQYNAGSDDNYDILSLDMISYSGVIDPNYGTCGLGGVTVINASPTVSHTTIASSYYGVYCNGTAAPLLDTIIIKDCSADPVAMSLVSNPVFNDIQFIANLTSGVRILEGTLAVDATLTQRSIAGIANVAYLVNDLIIAPLVTLTIDSGVVIKMTRSSCFPKIQVQGALIAHGSANDNIVFTSSADDSAGGDTNNDGSSSSPSPGDWDGIDFFSTADSSKSTLAYCDIRYGGGGIYSYCPSFGYPYAQGMVKVRDTKVIIDSCIFRLSGSSSIGIFGTADPLIENNVIENNNAGTPVYMSMFSNPAFANNSVLNTSLFALGIVPETYSENATVPQRNFAGYNNISYYIYPVGGGSPSLTINAGTTIAIPAGTVFKSNTNLYNDVYSPMIAVNGTLFINGAADSAAVVFTDYRDDAYGNPADMNQDGSLTQPSYVSYPSFVGNNGIIAFNATSNDASYIKYAIMRYSNVGVSLFSASPAITHCVFDNLNYGIELNGVSTPVVDNNTFNNLSYAPLLTSLVSYPSSTVSNTISGTTYSMIGVLSETLSQNVTLPQRNFAGKNNIPYFFTNYTVGTNAVLTIDAGVRCKFYDGYYYPYGIIVNNGLMALGTPTAPIVFTSWRDDAYGGDSNSDSTATTPGVGDWTGIIFNNTSVAPFCQMNNCIFRYGGGPGYYTGYTGVINAANASPAISYSNFNNNYEGVIATGAANPSITSCCFENNTSYAVNNVNQSFNITATNNFWGDPSGPTYSGNPGGTGEPITASVNYTPFQTTGCSTSPLMGDVSLNGVVTSYDASLVLQYAVSLITLNSAQLYVGDVSNADLPGSVPPDGPTAFDASLILQYVVGDIGTFPKNARLAGNPYQTNTDLIVGSANALPGDTITIPLRATNDSNLLSIELTLQYDTTYLQYLSVVPALSSMLTTYNNISNEEEVKIAMAGTQALTADTTIAWVTFCVRKNVEGTVTTPISVLYFLANETDLTASAKQGIVTINSITGIANQRAVNGFTLSSIYPNPLTDYTVITYQMASSQNVRMIIYDIIGKEVTALLNETQSPGIHSLTWDGEDKQGNRIEKGIYFLNIESGDFNETERIVVIK